VEKIHVVIDSTSCIDEAVLNKYDNLHKVSLTVSIGGREWDDDKLTARELFCEMERTGEFMQTSQPPVGKFAAVFQKIIDEGGEAIALCISGALSGTAQGAQTAANMVDAKKIHVIDTKTAAAGMVNLAECVLKNIAAKMELAEILADLEKRVEKTHTILVPGTLEYLKKGGRIGSAAALLGSILQIKPVLYLKGDGTIAVLDKVRTKRRAMARMLEEAAKTAPPEYIAAVHVAAEKSCEELYGKLTELYPDSRIAKSEAGAVIAAHTGPDTLAVIYQDRL
jgi:DegV family protein with EDD domain